MKLNKLFFVLLFRFNLLEYVRWKMLFYQRHAEIRQRRVSLQSIFLAQHVRSIDRATNAIRLGCSCSVSEVGASFESRIFANLFISSLTSARLAAAIGFFWRSSVNMLPCATSPYERSSARPRSTRDDARLLQVPKLSSVHIWPGADTRWHGMTLL